MTENQLQYVSGSIHSGTLVVTVLVERILDPEISYALRDEILSLVDPSRTRHVVLDLRRVVFVGSIGLLAFLAVRRHLEGGEVVICNLADPVRQVFEVCRLLSENPSVKAPFLAEDSLEAALARCSG